MKKALLFVGALLFLGGCGYKSSSYNPSSYASSNAKNYGSMNNNERVHKATMRPYQINGKWYYPTSVALGERSDGVASWYGPKFHGKKTSNGETYSMYAHTAAHKTLPMNTIVRVTSKENGKSTIVRINDRGPFISGRIIDLSNSAAKDIDMIGKGTARVSLEVIGFNGQISNTIPLNTTTLANTEYKVANTQTSVEISGFMVQIGAFRNKEGAYRFQKMHSNYGYNAFVKEYSLNNAPIYRVMLSGFKSEAEARDVIASKKLVGSFIITQ
ncbi:septal ring lytic transglycosylase RlpA family protein [Helicobacter burdigaliensis]|uniref:septal ring lytic transglycosylase RlpA family protein n=1 Tax=Helicobacter burdigaliensis TaxID=2315334 RepID=UPI000EF6582A|nr:septal ring lytic transglycosylase RlpA family protein [Helicobacter burdigaliensis]